MVARTGDQHGRGPVPYWPVMGMVVVTFLCWYAGTHAVRDGSAQLIGMVIVGMVGTSVMDLVEWWNGDTVDEPPECCGEPMSIDSYDGDDDVYVYTCMVNRKHTVAVTDDTETWK